MIGSSGSPSWCIGGILSLPISYLYIPYATRSSSQLVDVAVSLFSWATDLYGQRIIHSQSESEAECQGVGFSMQQYPGLGQSDIGSDYQASKNGDLVDVDDNSAPLPDGYMLLKEGIERFMITDINNPAASAQAQSTIPIMEDSWMDTGMFSGMGDNAVSRFNHVPGGSNVLYMDGHAEFIRYKTKYPVANSAEGTAGETLSTWMSSMGGVS